MRINYCPNCGIKVSETENLTHCPNCEYHFQTKEQQVKQANTKTSQAENSHSNKTTKGKGKMILYLSPILIIAAFLLGLFSPKIFGGGETEFPATMSKSLLGDFVSLVNEEELTEADITFSNIQTKVDTEEDDNDPGTYKVTGDFTYDDTEYSFTHEVFVYNGVYYIYDMPDYEES